MQAKIIYSVRSKERDKLGEEGLGRGVSGMLMMFYFYICVELEDWFSMKICWAVHCDPCIFMFVLHGSKKCK